MGKNDKDGEARATATTLSEQSSISPLLTYNAPGSKHWREHQLRVPKNRDTTDTAGGVRIDSGLPAPEEGQERWTEGRPAGLKKHPYNPARPVPSPPEPSTTAVQKGAATDFTATRNFDCDWRAGMKVLSPPRTSTGNSKAYTSTGKTWKDFAKGEVFIASWQTHSNWDTVDPKDIDLYITYDGPKIIKNRLFICVSKTETSMKAVPIFSHGDGGIEKIPEERQYEYACISQAGQKDKAPNHPGGLTMLWFESTKPEFVLRPTSTVRLTAAQPILYDQPITKVGQLTERSLFCLRDQIATAEMQGDRKFGKLTDKQQKDAKAAKTALGLSQVKTPAPRFDKNGRKY
ncbi:hypothetical protein CKM354_000417400 [Cercospora kikuchii]|uniref:DUF6590 domain-containing protein n=1 Tax=Cercospora kikuchii TaxID=84275 RepID=A0A9P3CGB6_9PEZI|nr:uncharacterized protein CKM354_000417400 [Cercospora kikuchii]GIZ40852.1 hypothetical protein CKM354_000417400 [Cercospora kikuchii]